MTCAQSALYASGTMPKRTKQKYVRPETDTRKEIRAVWASVDLLAQVDLCAAARRWTRAGYALWAIEEQVKRDLAAPAIEQPSAAACG